MIKAKISCRRAVRIATLAVTVFLVVLPLWLARGSVDGGVMHWLSNKAMAAVDGSATVRAKLGRDPDNLISMPEHDVVLAFSMPELKRMDGAVRVWQYRAQDCVLDVYFQDEKPAVSWYEMRPREKAADQKGDADSSGTDSPNGKSATQCMQGMLNTGRKNKVSGG